MVTANKTFNTRITHKIDIEANWMQAKNFTPLLGELIVYRAEKDGDAYPKDDENQDIRNYYITHPRVKIGDGKTNVNDLPFITDAIWEQVAQAQKFWAEDDNAGAVEFKAVTLAPANQGVY